MEIKYNSENSGHDDSWEVGVEFQDFVCLKTRELNILSLQNFGSKKYQYQRGENLQGVEIKYDARCTGHNGTTPTGRLAIELKEKSDKNIKRFTPSGIYRNDKNWLYIQGNQDMFWIFSKKTLRRIYIDNNYKEGYARPTSYVFYLPIEDADKYCDYKYNSLDENDTTLGYYQPREVVFLDENDDFWTK